MPSHYHKSLESELQLLIHINIKREKFIYNKILMADDGPTTELCNSMMNTCIQQPPTASNHTCDDSCYNFCWIQDVGDCADDDNSQTLCVSLQCQDWCVRDRCGSTTVWSNNMCEHDCSNKYMNVVEKDDINFVDYTNCMAECTPVPVFQCDCKLFMWVKKK